MGRDSGESRGLAGRLVVGRAVLWSGGRGRYWPGGGRGGSPLEGIASPGARSGQDSIGRVAADREAGAGYAGNSNGCGRSNGSVAIRPEAWAVTWGKLVNGAVE